MTIIVQHEPIAIQRLKWDNIDFFIYNYFQKDFCQNDLFSIKLKTKSKEGSRLKIERKFTDLGYTDKVKIWFGFRKINGLMCIRYFN